MTTGLPFHLNFPPSIWAVFIWIGCLALFDLHQRRLPNYLTLGGGFAGLVYLAAFEHSVTGASTMSVLVSVLTAILTLSPLFWLGWLGAGDVKLFAAIGCIGGLELLLNTFVLCSFLTLPAAMVVHWHKRRNADLKMPNVSIRLPQGVFIGMGLILSVIMADGSRLL